MGASGQHGAEAANSCLIPDRTMLLSSARWRWTPSQHNAGRVVIHWAPAYLVSYGIELSPPKIMHQRPGAPHPAQLFHLAPSPVPEHLAAKRTYSYFVV